jgi:7-cyano-7-deazaguanine synthase
MLYDLQAQGCRLHCLLFDYGQRHQQELNWAKHHCDRLNVQQTVICLPTLQGSILTGSGGTWVVPFRNPVMLAMAVNFAAAIEADCVTIACNADDSADFPDCRWEVMDLLNHAITMSRLNVEICAPYVNKKKWEIADLGRQLGVNMEETWSCYAGGKEPCGTCPACVKRKVALEHT